jgi:hypothetical protein
MSVDKQHPEPTVRCRPAHVADKSTIPNSVLSGLIEAAYREIDDILPEASGARNTFGPAADLLRQAVEEAGDLRSKRAREAFCKKAAELVRAFQRP